EQKGETVFADSLFEDIIDMGGLIGAQYSIDPLKNALFEEFGELSLGDLPQKVLISTFDLDSHRGNSDNPRMWKPKFFHNYPGKDSDADQSVVDVALRTANAPTYFPIYQGYIDGGVVANNPSVCALAQALHPPSGGQNLESITLLSLGTGHNPRFLDVQYGDWGLLHWAPHLVNIAMEGSASLVDYQCEQFLGKKYLRLNPVLPFPISMDKVEEIPLMIEIADQMDLSGTIHWIKRHYLS
ncbi:patatin-like phospholipase family protein, partial [Chloroflexota bacterium]